MNRTPWKLIFIGALLATASTTNISYARGGATGGAVAAAADESIAADQAAEAARQQAQAGQELQAENAVKPAAPTPVNPCAVPTLMSGSYIGVQLGYGPYRVRNSILTPGASTLTSNLVASANGWAAGALMGYGTMMNPWFYLGGEIFIVANNFDQNFSTANGPGSTTYTNLTGNGPTYGIGLLPGIKLTESTLTFIRLGWNRVVIKTFETVTGSASSNTSKTMDGLVFGIGMETLIFTNYSLRGEFDHMYFSSYNTAGPYNTLVNPSSNQFMMSLLYHFG